MHHHPVIMLAEQNYIKLAQPKIRPTLGTLSLSELGSFVKADGGVAPVKIGRHHRSSTSKNKNQCLPGDCIEFQLWPLLMTGWWHRSPDRRQLVCRQSQSDLDWLHSLSDCQRVANNCCLIYKQIAISLKESLSMSTTWGDSARCQLLVLWLYSCRTGRLMRANVIVNCEFTYMWCLVLYHS